METVVTQNRADAEKNATSPDTDKPSYDSPFAKRLRELMGHEEGSGIEKINQEDLAEAIGATRQTVSKYMSGASYPTIPTLIKIARFFNVPADDIIGTFDGKEAVQRIIWQYTGLTSPSVDVLKKYNDHSDWLKMGIYNCFVSEFLDEFLDIFEDYLIYQGSVELMRDSLGLPSSEFPKADEVEEKKFNDSITELISRMEEKMWEYYGDSAIQEAVKEKITANVYENLNKLILSKKNKGK
jgi:transcriptional regulator with XRE-family HTH domain